MSDMLDDLQRPNDLQVDDFADEVDMSTLVIIGGPRTITDVGAIKMARGHVEKYMSRFG